MYIKQYSIFVVYMYWYVYLWHVFGYIYVGSVSLEEGDSMQGTLVA